MAEYSEEEKITAVKLYHKYHHLSWVIDDLGYPSRNTLTVWIKEYENSGRILNQHQKNTKYSKEQRETAIKYYLENGMSTSKTIKTLGYPGKTLFQQWLNEDIPKDKRRWHCKANGTMVRCSQEQKVEAVKKYYSGKTPKELAEEFRVTSGTIHIWARNLLGQEKPKKVKKQEKANQCNKTVPELLTEKEELENKVQELQNEIYRLQLQKDILEKAGEILKKEKGINLSKLSNREKAVLIDALRNNYRLKDLLCELEMSKSSYCYQENSLNKKDKYEYIRKVIKDIFTENYCSYGYRRIYGILKRNNIVVSEKVIRRIMHEEGLFVSITLQKKYSSYKGEISPEVPNVIERNFHASQPNQKWLTDITEFRIPAGKVYLSPIIDCFDGLAVSWSIGTSPDAELVNGMLDSAISMLDKAEKPIIHSDRGCHYRWPGWIERMNNAGLTRSMSKKACSPDNSACEGFFGRLKNEMFYGRSWVGTSIEDFVNILDEYIHWYNEKRIKKSLGYLSPKEYRINEGLCTNFI